jgi:hypothetical protein
MLRRQFQKQVVAWIVVVAEPRCFEAVIVCGSLFQLLGHFHPSDEHRTIQVTASNAVLYSCRTHGCGHQEDRAIVRYRDTPGARRPPSSRALPSHPVFHEKKGNSVHHGRRAMGRAMAARASKKMCGRAAAQGLQIRLPRHKVTTRSRGRRLFFTLPLYLTSLCLNTAIGSEELCWRLPMAPTKTIGEERELCWSEYMDQFAHNSRWQRPWRKTSVLDSDKR